MAREEWPFSGKIKCEACGERTQRIAYYQYGTLATCGYCAPKSQRKNLTKNKVVDEVRRQERRDKDKAELNESFKQIFDQTKVRRRGVGPGQQRLREHGDFHGAILETFHDNRQRLPFGREDAQKAYPGSL